MFKSFKYKLKPTKAQIIQLQQIGGGTRWLWNYMLNQSIQQYSINKKFMEIPLMEISAMILVMYR